MDNYRAFLASKAFVEPPHGKVISVSDVNPVLFQFQRDVTVLGVGKGRTAYFCDTGLGKTLMQLEWGRHMGGRGLVIAPLSVTRQTIKEGKDKLELDVHYTRSGDNLSDGINITNYQMIGSFNADAFEWVVLDESSILKSLDGETRKLMTVMFRDTPYKLACTATPAPNDVSEIGRHSEFLGIMTDKEMLAAFFINDQDKGWRLKGNAVEPFYRWLASWAIAIRRPSDLGYSDDGYVLPELRINPMYAVSNYVPEGQLFFTGLRGITDRAAIRHKTLEQRVALAVELVGCGDEQWIVWCGLNDESEALAKAIPGAIELSGDSDPDKKVAIIEGFQEGRYRVLVTKPKIAGMGMNFQNCHNMAFVGLNDSWEQYYQSIRRCYRYGQIHPVNVYIIVSDVEDQIYQNIVNKEREASGLMDSLVKAMRGYTMDEMSGARKQFEYKTDEANGRGWRLLLGDSCERMSELEDNSVDLSIFSPPFISLYTYTPTERDMGNSRDEKQFFEQFNIVIEQLLRITKPGRNACIHVQQVGATKVSDGYIGIKDFRGDVIRAFIASGWIFHGETTIDKNPQVQAIRKKVKGLMFAQLEKDSADNRPAFADYVLIFKKPGVNEVAVKPQCTREEWIEWAHPVWYSIRETDVLNTEVAKGDKDERHICPLQLGLIERCIRLWSNEGETVFDPFNGIASTGHEALKANRQYIGIELKPEYYRTSIQNLQNAEREGHLDLFDWAELRQREHAAEYAERLAADAEAVNS